MSDRMLFAKRQIFLIQVGSGSDENDREKDSKYGVYQLPSLRQEYKNKFVIIG